jgi:hypothetical protein
MESFLERADALEQLVAACKQAGYLRHSHPRKSTPSSSEWSSSIALNEFKM